MYDLDVLKRSDTDRRAFLTRMGAAGLGAAAVALLSGCGGDSGSNNGSSTPDLNTTRSAFTFTQTANSSLPTTALTVPGASQNIVVLNFALTLEYLEADLYRQALNLASGRLQNAPLDTTAPTGGSLGSYVSTGNYGASLTDPGLQAAAFAYLVQFAYVEAAHRDFLIAALGAAANPLQGPTKTYQSATLNALALAGTPSLSDLLAAIYPLEETGTRAYLGAAPYLQDNAHVQIAASIYSTECRHSASIAYILAPDGSTVGPRKNIQGVAMPEYDVAVPPNTVAPPASPTIPTGTNYVPDSVFEKAVAPSDVLKAASIYLK